MGAGSHAPWRQDPASGWSSRVRPARFCLKVAISVGRVTSGKTTGWAQHPPGWASPPRGEHELQRWVPASGGLTALGRPGAYLQRCRPPSWLPEVPQLAPSRQVCLMETRPSGSRCHGREQVGVECRFWLRAEVELQDITAPSCLQQQPPSPSRGGGPRCGSRTHLLLFQITFYILVKAIYTLGYSVSLISLTTGSIILCLFR